MDRGIRTNEFVERAIYCFTRLNQMGARGIFILHDGMITIVGTDGKIPPAVNDNEAKE